ncbi:MAG: DUF4423 domain-containing protein [Bacteriovoracaceae bacterium]|nr:DUF4423 domain-containing protein [Bacteriovoracaceae bacterium]
MNVKQPDIQEYKNYRDFLKDFAQFKKFSNPYWSYGSWAKDLGLNGASTLSMILKGKRHPSKKLADTFCNYFKFNEPDKNYFHELIKIQKQTKDDPTLTVLLLEQKGLEENKEEKPLFFDWRAFAIRELTQMDEFDEDPKWISTKLGGKLSPDESKEIVQKLVEYGALERSPSGRLRATSQVIQPSDGFTRSQARTFHHEVTGLTQDAFELPINQRAFHSSTLSMKKEKIDEAKKLIREFQINFSKLMEDNPGDEVYQFNMQFFPLTKFKENN